MMTVTLVATIDTVLEGQPGVATLSHKVQEEMISLLREALAKYTTCPEWDERAANVLSHT